MNHDSTAVVQATAGHDKGSLFFVKEQDENFLYLVNGRQRKLGTPKKKKQQHVAFLIKEQPLPHSDKAIRQALAAFEKEGITLGKR